MLKSKRAEPIILKSCLPKQQNIERAYFLKNFELYGFYLIKYKIKCLSNLNFPVNY